MHHPPITRAKATRLAAVFVAVALGLGAGGFTAMSASAAATTAPGAPTNLFAASDDGSGVYVYWDATSAGDGTDDADTFTVNMDDGVSADHRSASTLNEDFNTTLVLSVPPGTYDVTVTAKNSHGSATSEPLTYVSTLNTSVPSAPLNVVAHNDGDGIVRITWDPPTSEGDSAIEEYQVSLQFPNSVDPSYGGPYGYWNGQIIDATGRDYTFGSLAFNHGDFIVTVNAVNSSRYPGYLTSTDPAPLVRSTVSSAPTHLAATNPAAHKVTITWDAPTSDGGFPVTDYQVTMGSDFFAWVSASDRTATFTGVPAGSHTVAVSGFNVNGQSVEATRRVTVRGQVAVMKAPSPPRNVAVATRTGGKAIVTFTAPRYLHHGAITRYIVKLAGQRKLVDGATHTVQFRGLTKGTYKVKVYARNKAGRSRPNTEPVVMSRAKAAAKPITLKLGMLGWNVRQLQNVLLPTKTHKGAFDIATRDAVVRWQSNHHKELTGIVNASMRAALHV